VEEIANNSIQRIEKVYITGSASVINNIDLYFQEYFSNMKCEILKPYFVSENININIKDYIEVNSAIALAMGGLGIGIKNISFKNPTFVDKLPGFLKLESKDKKAKKENKDKKDNILKNKINISFDFKAKWDRLEKWFLRTSTSFLAFLIIYISITSYLNAQTNNKYNEVEEVKKETNQQISLVNADIQKLNNKTTDYQTMTENLKNYSNEVQELLKTKNVIPLLLTRIMNVIPKGVTITSIENPTGSHVIIYAQSENYDLLGFFKGSLIVEGILNPTTVISTSGVKQDGIVKIVIEGDLP